LAFTGSLAIFSSKIADFVLERPAGLTLEELETSLLGAGKDRL